MIFFSNGIWQLNDDNGFIMADNERIAQVFGATVHNHEDNREKCFAYARLIAHAPEMYEAIRNLIDKDSTVNSAEALLDAFLELKILLTRIDGTEADYGVIDAWNRRPQS